MALEWDFLEFSVLFLECSVFNPPLTYFYFLEMIESREKRATSTTLYRAACEEILKFGHMVPSDLLEQFKQRDMNDVLRLGVGNC